MTVVGASVVLLGIAMIVLPGPAMLVIPAGLAILGLEWAWARRWLKSLRNQAVRMVGSNWANRDRAAGGNGSRPADEPATNAAEPLRSPARKLDTTPPLP